MAIHQPELHPAGAPRTGIEEHPMKPISKIRNFVAATMLVGLFTFAAVACGQDTEPVENTGATGSSDAPAAAVEEVSNLPAAPDFTLPAANRDSTEISLSQFQGDKPVVLVFYRAYW